MSPLAPHNRLDTRRAAASAVGGYLIWGLSPLFYKLLDFTSAGEILLHRAVWSMPVLLALVLAARRWNAALTVLADRRSIAILILTSALIGTNWWLFVYAVNTDRVLEISLGYFINPLMNVAVGVLILGERFGRLRAMAIGLAALGVMNQIITVGSLPVIALVLAATFCAYGYLRKIITIDGRIGLFWETAIIAAPCLIMIGVIETGPGGSFTQSWTSMALLLATGPMTVAPLLLFILGARGLPLAVIGTLQFIAPTLQFAIGVATGEPFSWAHGLTFTLIWGGLAVFVIDLIVSERRKSDPRPTT